MSGYGWVQEELERLADPGYRAFHEGLIPGVKMSYGVPSAPAAGPGENHPQGRRPGLSAGHLPRLL